jgi:diaminohydroxyphosphoribosylaminopyrimidine deaminase/5-amino-6-(5-phosphoribosylamino)uracil reductase
VSSKTPGADADFDRACMRRAIALAAGVLYRTSPNPRVGCVLARDGRIVGEGATEAAGRRHAEIVALDAARARGVDPRGCTAYVTLEPCAHVGRTPPCADALLAAGVERVVAAGRDPNPRVAGGGLQRLAAAGVRTECGLLENAARELNLGFFSRCERGRPWLRLKAAASLDGITALPDGSSQWITSAAARADGHHWRARACALLTGIGTVRDDDPELTVRHVATPRQPPRIVVDSRLQLSPTARLLRSGQVWVAHLAGADAQRAAALRERGAELIELPADPNAPGKTDLHALLRELAAREVGELHVEAGAALNASLLGAGLVDELLLYLAPKLLGQGRGIAPFGPLASVDHALRLHRVELERIGDDYRWRARIAY